MPLNTMAPGNTLPPWWAGDAMGVGASDVAPDAPLINKLLNTEPLRRRRPGGSEGLAERHRQRLQQIASTKPIYTPQKTDLAPIVAVPPPAATPAPVATPAAWMPGGAGGSAPGFGGMGGSTSMPVPTDGGGFGMDDIGSMLSMAKLASKLMPGAYDPFGSQALWAATEADLPSVVESFARNPANFLEAYTGGHLEAAFADGVGTPMAQRAAFIASEFGAPGNVPSMLELTEISGGLGDAFLPSLEGIPQYTGADIAGFMDMGLGGPTHANTIANAIGGDPSMLSPDMARALGLHLKPGEGLIGQGYIDPWGTTPTVDWGTTGANSYVPGDSSVLSGTGGSDTLFGSGGPLTSAPAGVPGGGTPGMPWGVDTTSGFWPTATPEAVAGGLGPGVNSMIPGMGAGMFAAAAIPIGMSFLGLGPGAEGGILQTLGLISDPRDEQARLRGLQVEGGINEMARQMAAGQTSPEAIQSMLGDFMPSTFAPANQRRLADVQAMPKWQATGTGRMLNPTYEDVLLNQQAAGIKGVSELDELMRRNIIDSSGQVSAAKTAQEQLWQAAGLKDRAEYDELYSMMQPEIRAMRQGGMATQEGMSQAQAAYAAGGKYKQAADLFLPDDLIRQVQQRPGPWANFDGGGI